MDPISKLFTDWKIPVGKWGKNFIDFIIDHFQWFFDGISSALGWAVEGSSYLLLQVPPLLLAAILAGIAYWLQRSKWLALRVFVGLIFILNQGLWKETVQTLVLVSAATALSMAIGVPLGIWAAQKPDVWRVTEPLLDLLAALATYHNLD